MKPLPEETQQNSQVDLKLSKVDLCKQVRNEIFSVINNDQMEEAINIMKNRLPRSAHVYNMAKMACKFASITAYALNGDISENAIFVLIDIRQDYNQDINISVPLDFKISENVKQAFIDTSIIDWNAKYLFSALDRLISPMILEISTLYKKNSTLNNPNCYYYMSQEDSANLNLKLKPEVEVKPLHLDTNGGIDLLLKGWKFTRPGTAEFLQEVVEKGLSSGVFDMDGVPVCGIIGNRNGLMGMLFTAKDHRNKGYAQICTQYLMKQLGMNGLVVASAAEYHNTASCEFHRKAGMKMVHECDYISYDKAGFEAK